MNCKGKQNLQIISFKLNAILAGKWITWLTVFLFFYVNYSALVSSGVLASGGADFNAVDKYTLISNNYSAVSSLYGLLLAILLGAGTIGPDCLSKNIYILLTSYPSRKRYYANSLLASWLYYFVVHVLVTGDYLLLLRIFKLTFPVSDTLNLFLGILLNSTVLLMISGMASIFWEGYRSAIAGVFAYAFYYMYTFNTIPFVNTMLGFDMNRYKNILFHLVPVQYVLTRSITDDIVLTYYHISAIGGNAYLYQAIYCLLLLVLACFLFEHRDL